MLGTLNDVYRAARSVDAWGRQYDEIEIDTADGQRMVVLARTVRRARPVSTAYFGVSDISAAGETKIRVNDGVIRAPDTAGVTSDPPTLAALLKDYPVTGGDFSVVDGSKVYLKVTTTDAVASFVYEEEDEANDYVNVTVTNNCKFFTGTSGEVIVQTGEATSTADASYTLLAEIAIADGAMTISHKAPGPVTVPAVSAAYGSVPNLTEAFSTQTLSVCVSGSPSSVTFLVAA